MGGERAMRIGIDARFLTHPQEGGFKTYTENIVHGIAALDRRNEYVLFTDRETDETAAFVGNVEVRAIGGPAIVREQALLPLAMWNSGIDVAHFPCNTAPIWKPTRMLLTIHDLIPLMNPPRRKSAKQRLMAAYWANVIPAAAKRADHIITISETSKNDIRKILGVPEEKITIIPNGSHPDFRPIRDEEYLDEMREKYQLPNDYVLGFASSDPRKNVGTLIKSIGILRSKGVDSELVLVACSSEAWESVKELAKNGDVEPRLVQCPPRKDLAAIYSMANALAFPSLYEGFGLPVIEAMACGTPVVTSNVSSLPEVAGDAALLVDPMDAGAIADALSKVITDSYWREEMVEKGFARASSFSWQRTVEQTIAVYEKVFAEALTKAKPQPEGGGTK